MKLWQVTTWDWFSGNPQVVRRLSMTHVSICKQTSSMKITVIRLLQNWHFRAHALNPCTQSLFHFVERQWWSPFVSGIDGISMRYFDRIWLPKRMREQLWAAGQRLKLSRFLLLILMVFTRWYWIALFHHLMLCPQATMLAMPFACVMRVANSSSWIKNGLLSRRMYPWTDRQTLP